MRLDKAKVKIFEVLDFRYVKDKNYDSVDKNNYCLNGNVVKKK